MADSGLEITRLDGAGSYALAGSIDETARLDHLAANTPGRLELDLGQVRHINSVGVREWIRLLLACEAGGIAVVVHRAPEVMVQQMNMIVEAKGAAHVRSFFAPYQCESCDHDDSILLDCVVHGGDLASRRAPAVACRRCGSPMAFDDFPDTYFLFLDDTAAAYGGRL